MRIVTFRNKEAPVGLTKVTCLFACQPMSSV